MSVQSNEAAQKTINEDFPLALPKGSVLAGQYTIDDVLGQGGFGITYVATDYKTGQKVAVKEFFPDSLAYREMTTVISYPGERAENYEYGKENFLGEAKTLAEFIGCENIVRIFSYFEENGTAYFVMEYIEGVSFDHYLKERGGKISCDEAKSILVPVMEALAIVHSKGIVHRDVTPDNIYITNDGTVKLLDFGAARYSLGDKSKSLDVILKHGFAPKEQYTRRGKQGPFTDIYSLGATFYFAITGRRPPDSIDRIEEDELIPPSSLGVKITSYQEEAILHALEVSPQSRYQSMLDFRNVLLNETAPASASAAVNQQFFTAPPTPAAMPVQQIPYTAQQPYPMTQQQPYPAPQQTENVTKLGDAAKQLGSAAVQLGGGVAKQLGNTAKQLGGSAAKHMSNAAKQLSEAAEKRKAEEAAKREAEEKRKAEEAAKREAAAKNEAVPQSVPEVQHDEPLQSNSEIPHTVQNADAPVIQPAANQPASSVPKSKKVNSKLIVALVAVVLIAGLSMVLNKDNKNNSVASSKNNYKNTYTTTAASTSKSSKTEETTAKNKSNVSIAQANKNAHTCYTACIDALTGMNADGENVPSGAIEGSGMDFTIGGVKVDFTNSLSEDFTGYTYGYVSDIHVVEYVLWSDIPIPDEYKHELTAEEQKELIESGIVIGCYPPQLKDDGGLNKGETGDVVMVTDQLYNGNYYTGEWKDNKPNGQGKLTFTDGSVYEGEFKDGYYNGKGKYTYSDGGVYEGEWKDNKFNGQGKLTHTNGDVYEGEWKDGKKDGQGKYTYANGSVVTGIWKDDKRIEENGIATNANENEKPDWSYALGKSPEEAVKIFEKVCGVSLPYYIEDSGMNIYYTSKTNSAIPFIDGLDMYFNCVALDCTSDNVVYEAGFAYSGPEYLDESTYHNSDECTLVFNTLYETFCEVFGEQYETEDFGDAIFYMWNVDGLYELRLGWVEKYPDGTEGYNDVLIAWTDPTIK